MSNQFDDYRRSTTGLLPCPFCGSIELSRLVFPVQEGNPEVMVLQCDHCGAFGPNGENEEQVRLLWDTRAVKA